VRRDAGGRIFLASRDPPATQTGGDRACDGKTGRTRSLDGG